METKTIVSKKSRAEAIFQTNLARRAAGEFKSNKEFRAAVLAAIRTELEVTSASAATMYNQSKMSAELKDPKIGLGRDPKQVAVKVPKVKPMKVPKADKLTIVAVEPVVTMEVPTDTVAA